LSMRIWISQRFIGMGFRVRNRATMNHLTVTGIIGVVTEVVGCPDREHASGLAQ
jgi:hypothetical protein